MLSPSSQKGVALITALLIVALATVISVQLSTHLQLDIRRTGNIIATDQSTQYHLLAEHIARSILREDRLNNNYDSFEDDWAMEQIPPLPVEGGTLHVKLSDLQACFNINSLVQNNQPVVLAQDRFRRLMQALPNPPTTDLSQAIIDWIDDGVTYTPPDGAEDSYYLNLERPYRSANQPIQSLSELRLIKGFEDDQIFQETEGLLCAFGPAADINVNTAPAEVLQSLAANIPASTVEDIITQSHEKPYEPYDTMQDFRNRHNLTTILTDTTGLSVSSDYFLLETEANIGHARTIMYSVIYRQDNGDTEVIARSQGAY